MKFWHWPKPVRVPEIDRFTHTVFRRIRHSYHSYGGTTSTYENWEQICTSLRSIETKYGRLYECKINSQIVWLPEQDVQQPKIVPL